jgi:hypothetical protein
MQIQNHTPSLECEGALSDLVLQAARAAIPLHVDRLITLPASGARNQPLLPLLVGLLDAAQATAKAVEDNSWDDGLSLDRDLAAGLAKQCRDIAAGIENASGWTGATVWPMPSMTEKELV